MDLQPLLSREQAAGVLGVPPKTLAEWASTGRGPKYLRVGRHARYRAADLDAWIAGRTIDPAKRGAA